MTDEKRSTETTEAPTSTETTEVANSTETTEAPTSAETTEVPSSAETTSKGRVLVIDDEEVVHASLRRILSRLDLAVDAVLSASEGIERLAHGQYDLLITDLMMPGMNGVEMLEELHRREIRIPTLMITGYPTIRTAVKALRLGAMDYIAKPYTRKELLGPVKRALRLEASPATGSAPTPTAPVTAADLAPFARFVLPRHAWAELQQDGTFRVGLEATFLQAAGVIVAAEGPQEMDLLEQGFIGVRLTSQDGDVHGVAMPLSGQVTGVNEEALASPETITAETWLVRLIPSQLASELELLIPR